MEKLVVNRIYTLIYIVCTRDSTLENKTALECKQRDQQSRQNDKSRTNDKIECGKRLSFDVSEIWTNLSTYQIQ